MIVQVVSIKNKRCNVRYYFVIDIMECQDGLHNCSQKCIELEGGFSCACNEGYNLQKDRASCLGKQCF